MRRADGPARVAGLRSGNRGAGVDWFDQFSGSDRWENGQPRMIWPGVTSHRKSRENIFRAHRRSGCARRPPRCSQTHRPLRMWVWQTPFPHDASGGFKLHYHPAKQQCGAERNRHGGRGYGFHMQRRTRLGSSWRAVSILLVLRFQRSETLRVGCAVGCPGYQAARARGFNFSNVVLGRFQARNFIRFSCHSF